MSSDLPLRLVVAYGLMGLLVLAAVTLAWWALHNTQRRRDERARLKLDAYYRRRDAAAAAEPADT